MMNVRRLQSFRGVIDTLELTDTAVSIFLDNNAYNVNSMCVYIFYSIRSFISARYMLINLLRITLRRVVL